MTTITKIMVAVDFSDYSVAAAEYAAKLGRRCRGETIVDPYIQPKRCLLDEKGCFTVSGIFSGEKSGTVHE